MSLFVEAMLLLLPPDAGGRAGSIAPRDGSYQPFAWIDEDLARVRVIEGPPLLAPGDEARVMLEVEPDLDLHRDAELRLIEGEDRVVGIATIVRVCRTAAV